MLLTCPWCGPRSENEFHFGGPAHLERPSMDCSDAEWASYLFMRDNPLGEHRERWRHTYGCGQWFNVLRNTVTHEVTEVYRMGETGGRNA
ncbi:sarcosine oxidase subunit delta [Bordetella sp. BOR01]|uniref:sarcosine oxidase subunit delta n=1 Tax=Bordetella sp. BOR01 TaxID=2854779 RepID=UPI0021070E63|nr:sarcosine oxidase subunit delta [Bordetella sp. BOR01]